MSSYLKNRQQKRNLKENMLFSTLKNDISNEDFDAYYQRCQTQKKLRIQSQETVVEDSDTNSSEYSSTSSSPAPYSYEDSESNDEMNTYLESGNDVDISHEDEMYQSGYFKNLDSVYREYENNYDVETYTDEEIDRAFYEAEKWSDF